MLSIWLSLCSFSYILSHCRRELGTWDCASASQRACLFIVRWPGNRHTGCVQAVQRDGHALTEPAAERGRRRHGPSNRFRLRPGGRTVPLSFQEPLVSVPSRTIGLHLSILRVSDYKMTTNPGQPIFWSLTTRASCHTCAEDPTPSEFVQTSWLRTPADD